MTITVSYVGNVGGDAETRQAGNGSVTSFNVAVSQGFGDKKTTNWLRTSLWGQRGEKLAQYITKGTMVYVTGELSFDEYNGKTQFNVRANDVNPFLGKRESSGGYAGSYNGHPDTNGSGSAKARELVSAAQAAGFNPDLDDEVPF